MVGGKLGIDVTAANIVLAPQVLGEEELLSQIQILCPEVVGVQQYMLHTNNPIAVVSVKKSRSLKECFHSLIPLNKNIRIIFFVDEEKNDIANPYMLIWRVANNIDAMRDIFTSESMVGIDGTNKNKLDNFYREWPGDVVCTKSVIESLKQRGLWTLDDSLHKKYQI